MNLDEFARWIEAELGQWWPEATLDTHEGRDGNHVFRIRADGGFFFLRLDHRILLDGTNEGVVDRLGEDDWISRLKKERCLLVGMRRNAPVLLPCSN